MSGGVSLDVILIQDTCIIQKIKSSGTQKKLRTLQFTFIAQCLKGGEGRGWGEGGNILH